jgi:hypothetical protein
MCSTEPTRRQALRRGTLGAAGLLALHGCGQSLDSVQVVPVSPTAGTSRPAPSNTTVGTAPLAAEVPEARVAPDGSVEVMPGLNINPRSVWGAELPPKSAFEIETVRFLLVHHTASSNNYDDPLTVIQNTHVFHTSAAKNWGDVAYHFFVARDGSVWEGRAGSLDGPVVADASGGNQGWAQLVCLIGNHVQQAPTPAAQASLVQVLKWLTWRYRLDTDPAATTDYVSRGSDKYPAGTAVTTPIISGHRDATYTACPGDAAYHLLPTWRQQVAAMPDPVFVQTGRYPPAEQLGLIEP